MDGTLLDTEVTFRRSWLMTSEKYGLENAEAVYEHIAGASAEGAFRVLYENYGDRINPEKFFAERTDLTIELFEREGVVLKPGCVELLEFLKSENIPVAVATSTPLYISGANLKRAGIFDYFDAVVTSEHVKHGKPAPDIFMEAGKRIGAEPKFTFVAEDSENGLCGAIASGMKSVFIFDRQVPSKNVMDDVWVSCRRLDELIDIVKRENDI